VLCAVGSVNASWIVYVKTFVMGEAPLENPLGNTFDYLLAPGGVSLGNSSRIPPFGPVSSVESQRNRAGTSTDACVAREIVIYYRQSTHKQNAPRLWSARGIVC
jgi:hypothetical protein